MLSLFENRDGVPPERSKAGPIFGGVLACAALPHALLHQALAATAGTLFEAAPFVLAVCLVRGRLVRPLASLLGCGCGGAAGLAALSLPATALCWTVFGPWVALGRFGAAVALTWVTARRDAHIEEPDVLEQLTAIALPAFGLALATIAATSAPWFIGLLHGPLALGLTLAAGLAAGSAAPCATAAVALAAMVRGTLPFASAGILATAGLVRLPRAHRACRGGRPPGRDARLALILVAIACAALGLRGGSGFVHPRLVPILWLAVPAALLAARGRPRTHARFAPAAPVLMIAALIAGSPLPDPSAVATQFDGVYPGERVSLIGRASDAHGTTALVRYAITCCRADAVAVLAPTDIRARFPGDTWLAVSGTIAHGERGDYIHTTSWHRVPPPRDPFTYR